MATSTTALSTAGFVDSIGVNIHMPYDWTAYGNLNLVEQSLGYLGVDNVRDSLVPWSQIQPKYQALMDLGYHFDFILPIASIDIPGYVSLVDSYVKKDPGGVLAIEGPNEVNIWPVTYNGVSGPAGAVQFQTALYYAVRADPALNNIPVYNLTLGTADANAFKQLGNLSSVANYGNIHPYLHDDRAPVLTEQALFPLAQIDTPGKPAVITETGYTTATNNTYNGISEVGQAKYTLDTLMDAYKAGFSHTFLYELLDENSDPSNTNSEIALWPVQQQRHAETRGNGHSQPDDGPGRSGGLRVIYPGQFELHGEQFHRAVRRPDVAGKEQRQVRPRTLGRADDLGSEHQAGRCLAARSGDGEFRAGRKQRVCV